MARLLAQPSIKLSTDRNVIPPSPTTELDKMARSVNPEERPTLRRYTSMTMEEKTSTELDLPRGSFVLIGGDLAYPSPCDETYSTRLFGPYSDALRGNYSLRRLFHLNQKDIVEPDPEDSDKAHITLLDAQSVANIVQGKNSLRQNANTVEEALRTVPLLFAIPGNHDWFDGLSTYSKYIVEKTWMGGWLMPQKSSYFLLRLPLNWFIICCDTGNTKDIDATQKNYFLGLIDSEMDEESCVILTCHEPGWLADAMELGEHSIQPEIDCLVRVLGTRVRVRIAGDIHNYSRHEPKDTASEAATLLVSGGGGAFLHGARGDKIISQGTEYVRASAFPRNNTYMSMASRLWGFRVVNWKFDLIIGHLCIGLIYSFLPLDAETLSKMGTTDSLTEFFSRSTADTMTLVYYLFFNAHFSLFPLLFYFMCFSLAGADRGASPLWRAAYGGLWTLVVVIVCCGMLVSIYNMVGYMQNKGALFSSAGRWESMLEQQTRTSLEQLIDHAIAGLGETSYLSGGIAKWASYFFNSYLLNIYSFVLKCMDPIETFAYLSLTLASGTMGEFKQEATRLQVLCYYAHLMMFFWVTVTPLVSFIIGIFLFISVRCFDYMYDGVYSAFQIENYKHFLRFRLDHRTRELHCFVIARETIPTVWELDPQHLAEYNSSSTLPPHLRRFPSRWKSILPSRRKNASYKPKLHDSFIVKPHRLPTKNT
ncbi:hypothetical protein ADEAN_000273500 [Angomonas deanei]|uniref:Calcineurin-like phosphoesterase domain-containing protein n=1 Tax=Angomonas deanei TaxID=59799 RepID=A0A7G2C663_9TRYP|nr:hypothetical protein ADEAN_000273500 [Angomonas deanei]